MIIQTLFRRFSFLFMVFITLAAAPCMGVTRDYNLRVEGEDRENLRHVVLILGRESQAKILVSYYKSLNEAGEKIRHLHPLRFLERVFTEEDLKVAIRGIPGKIGIDGEFFGPLIASLNDEYSKGNMPDAFIRDFATNINLNAKYAQEIETLIHQRRWRDFIMKLIAVVPRQAGTNRYNM